MPNFLAAFQSGMLADVHNKYIAKELLALNEHTTQSGIVLSEQDCKEIAECRSDLLIENERIEIGAGAISRIIERFCDNSYVDQKTFKDTVNGLLECFYSIKTETEDMASDDDVLDFIECAFETTGGDVAKIYMIEPFDAFIASFRDKDSKIKKTHNDTF